MTERGSEILWLQMRLKRVLLKQSVAFITAEEDPIVEIASSSLRTVENYANGAQI